MAGHFFSRITTIVPLLAVALAAGWIVYTVRQSELKTTHVSPGLLTEIAAADRAGDAEEINRLLEQGWSGVVPAADKTAINEPIMLALLELQIEMRRLLGHSFKSQVPVVGADPACQVDLIEQQLIWLYAASVATTDGTKAQGTTGQLARFARLLTCISGLQAAMLDTAMTSSFNTVGLRLQQRNLDQLVPYLARFIAPWQLLMLDARKHVGVQSAAWRWFNRWNQTLIRQVAFGGWATDRVYLWDRRHGVLAGFAPCDSGKLQRYCVDIKMLLNTISEAKTLGKGDCSFAGMIAGRGYWTETGERYICALNYCNDRKRYKPKVPLTDAQMEHVQALWPGLVGEEDRKLLGELCFSPRVDPQSAYHEPDYCLQQLYGSRAANPFNHHLACLHPIQLAAKANDQWQLITDLDLSGIPQNPRCEMLAQDTSQNLPLTTGCDGGGTCLDFTNQLKAAPETATQDTSGLLADDKLAKTLLNPADQGIAGLCDSPAGCVTQCTALSQQISRPGSCGLTLDPDKAEDLPVTIPAEQLGDPMYLISWNQADQIYQENDPSPDDSYGSCGVGHLNEARPVAHCGLIICADGAPAIGVNSACSCRTEFGGNFTRELMCKKLHCADGLPADENCNCFAPPIPSLLQPVNNNPDASIAEQ